MVKLPLLTTGDRWSFEADNWFGKVVLRRTGLKETHSGIVVRLNGVYVLMEALRQGVVVSNLQTRADSFNGVIRHCNLKEAFYEMYEHAIIRAAITQRGTPYGFTSGREYCFGFVYNTIVNANIPIPTPLTRRPRSGDLAKTGVWDKGFKLN